jgi:hypothetical protein
MSIPQPLLRDEVPRNEAYIEVRRSASGPEGLRPAGTRDKDNAALRCFDLAQGREPAERQMGVFRQLLKDRGGISAP